MKILKDIKELPKTVRTLGWISFLNDSASELLAPILPLFITNVLGLNMAALGTIEGLAQTTAALTKAFFGHVSDRIKHRKAFVITGYLLAALSRPLWFFVNSMGQAIALRITDRIGKGIRTAPRDAILKSVLSSEQRGLGYGFHRGMDNAGAMVGPLTAMILMALIGTAPTALRWIMAIAAIPGIIAVFLSITGITEPKIPQKNKKDKQKISLPLNFYLYLFVLFIFSMANSADAFLIIKASKAGISMVVIPLLWLLMNLVRTIGAPIGGQLSDKYGRLPLLIAGWFIYFLTYLGFAFSSRPWQIFALFALYGVFYSLSEGAEKALVADIVDQKSAATAFGLFHSVIGIAALPASLLMGYLWDLPSWGPKGAFTLSAALALISSLLLIVLKNQLFSHEKNS